MSELEDEQIKSREVKALAGSPNFGVFKQKLIDDYIAEINNLIAQDSAMTRAKINVIQEILGWFDINVSRDEEIKKMKKKNLTDDY